MEIPRHYKLMELFCGPGGLAKSALVAKIIIKGAPSFIEPVWANDIDQDACRTYSVNIKNKMLEDASDTVVCGDIAKVAEAFPHVDFNSLAFGFPCNDYSMVGESKGIDGSYGPLYTFGVRALNARNPYWFLAENVGGIRNANEGIALQTILNDLENSGRNGYHLTAHLYRFEEYGVPQARHRVIIVGIRKDLKKKFEVPAPLTPNPWQQVTCQQAIEIPPIPSDASNNERTNQSVIVEDRLMCLPPGANAWFLDKILQESDEVIEDIVNGIPTFRQRFPWVQAGAEVRAVIENVKLNVKSARMSHIYRRLDPNRPSYTITGSGGGGTHVYHWEEPRALTNRERARLQTFDDNFIFLGSKESVRKQIGMAVPPEGAKHIFQAILKTMGGVKYAKVPANLYETEEQVVKLETVLGEDRN